jgi:hypothetical protein
MKMRQYLYDHKYELLLIALLQHLFIGVFLSDLPFYTLVIWPINMLVLGVATAGVFMEKGRWKHILRNALFVVVLALPLGLPFSAGYPNYFLFLNAAYVVYFIFILSEVMRYLLRPGYINSDIISAAGCGYLLLLEIAAFMAQYFYYQNPASFKGIDASGTAAIYIDLVYFSSITLTSIGFGDITPSMHHTKLLTSLFGIAGQFYMVVLLGILISKFTANRDRVG